LRSVRACRRPPKKFLVVNGLTGSLSGVWGTEVGPIGGDTVTVVIGSAPLRPPKKFFFFITLRGHLAVVVAVGMWQRASVSKRPSQLHSPFAERARDASPRSHRVYGMPMPFLFFCAGRRGIKVTSRRYQAWPRDVGVAFEVDVLRYFRLRHSRSMTDVVPSIGRAHLEI